MKRKTTVVAMTFLLVQALPKTVFAATSPKDPLGNPVMSWIQLFVSLVLILALAIFSIRFLAKRSNVALKGSIQVLAARQIAPNRSVQVIAVENKKYLIGVGNEITLLADVTDDYPNHEGPVKSEGEVNFPAVLEQALQTVRNRYRGAGGKETDR